MNGASIVAILLAAGALLGCARVVRGAGRYRLTRIALQIATAALLYLCLFPPSTREPFAAGELVVLTPGTTAAQLDAVSTAATVVALPGALERSGIERVPDLGTALRRHPDNRRLRIVGGGLPTRDRDAARTLVASFDAAPLPRGVVELDMPTAVRAGSAWRLAGRVEAVAEGRVELRDPSGAVVASHALGADGRFALSTRAKGEGEALFALRVLDRGGAHVEDIQVPLVARRGEPLNVLLFAGAPDPELKYLRRWAIDAGVQLDSRMGLSEGVALTEGAAALDVDALRKADIAIVDERAWAAFGAAQKEALTVAVRDGFGLLLRVTGPIAAPVAADWAALGFRAQARDAATAVSLDKALDLGDSGLTFARRALDVDATDAAPLLRADDGTPLALWRAQGQGRVALWWLVDSWRLGLGGDRTRLATLWSETLATLARARGKRMPDLPADARIDERLVLCGLAPDAMIETAHGEKVALIVERDATQRGCAAYWPAQTGWQTLVSAGAHWPFHVRAADEARALAVAESARATHALLGAANARTDIATRSIPLPRWPFFMAWLAAIMLLWLIERRAASAGQL
ncbi:hypothetical protein [Dokdonella soli]|uniref:Carboxypeptidase regulatory-like domain-containing protein n=1 Tax=Dokdonella soli TaxID=529810 RepID=A0ABP3TQD5_9GAMM